MKTKLTFILCLLISLNNGFAQVKSKLSPAFRYLISHPLNSETAATYPNLYKPQLVEGFNSNTGLYEKGYVCIIYTKNSNLLIEKGITVQSILPNFVTAWVSLYQISQLSEMTEVYYVDAPKIILPNNDICVGSSGASLLNEGRLNNTIYKGDGVIVGIYDTGIDWDHLDFRNPSDTTKSRILKIWDQTITPITGEVSPTGLNYGVEYTQAQLNDELDGTPTGYVRQKDLNGHGSHVAGTAAGNGASLATRKYAGIAPNADIVVVKGGNGSFSTTNIINGLTYFQNVATALGKPIIVNMSLGGQSGAHDGTNAEEIAVDYFSNTPGRVVAIAAGNDNGTGIHKQVSLAANGSNTMTINVPTASGSTSTDVFEISIYANNANAVNAVVTVPGGATVTANAGQIISPTVLSNAATVYLDNVVDAASGLRNITLYVARNSTSANASGTWTITLNNATATTLTMDGWLDYKGTNYSTTTVSGGDNNYLVGSPGTATSAITVASYMGKLDWYSTSTTAAGGYRYTSGQQDNISTFSSNGPRRDNVQKPNITANGQAVVSCLASDAGISPTSNTVVVQGLYRAIQGTSMATPEVAGCVALLLQARPTATFNQIRNAITTTATKDVFTTASDNATWGSGKIDVFKAASSLLFCKTSTRVTYSYDSSSTSTNNGSQILGSSKAATRFTPDMSGKLGGVYFKTGTTVTVSSFTIEVRTNSGGIPGSLLGSLNITPSSISRFSWNYYDVSSLNLSVTNGTDYFIVLVPGSSDSWALGFESLSNSGRSFINSGSSWSANNDLRIRSVVYDNTLPTSSSITNASICSGNNYSFNGTNYSSAGTYTTHLTNAVGCDSAATLVLSIQANYTITASAGSNGNISPNGVSTVCDGSNLTYTISPNAGYAINNVVVDGVNKGSIGTFAFTNITANHSISASFSSLCVPSSSTMNASICNGSAYVLNGTSYTATGTYTTHLINVGGCDSAVTLNLTVVSSLTPSVSINTATAAVCSGNSVTFTATGNNTGSSPIYQWKKNGISVGNSTSIVFVAGTLVTGDIITSILTANNTCQTTATAVSNVITVTVNASPAIGTSTIATLCTFGSTTRLYNTVPGGIWSSNNTNIATVANSVNSSTGIATAIANGTANISYTITGSNGCSAVANSTITVAAVAIPNAITGTANICVGATTTLSNTTTGGVWSSLNNRATINASGIVTGASAGAASIKYTVSNSSGCSNGVSYNITVNSLPNVPTIQYAAGTVNPQTGAGGSFCANRTFTVVGSPTGGTWTSTGVLTVGSSSGIVNTGNIAGAGSLIYTYSMNGCSNSRTIAGNITMCASRGVSREQLEASGEFTMYPNPAKTFISLSVKTLMCTGSIVVTDLYGKQVTTQTLSLGNNIVDITTLSKAVYFVSVITSEGKTTKKLVVE
jgi:subtilisin family serine protease